LTRADDHRQRRELTRHALEILPRVRAQHREIDHECAETHHDEPFDSNDTAQHFVSAPTKPVSPSLIATRNAIVSTWYERVIMRARRWRRSRKANCHRAAGASGAQASSPNRSRTSLPGSTYASGQKCIEHSAQIVAL
jgi:hypothetical protein